MENVSIESSLGLSKICLLNPYIYEFKMCKAWYRSYYFHRIYYFVNAHRNLINIHIIGTKLRSTRHNIKDKINDMICKENEVKGKTEMSGRK